MITPVVDFHSSTTYLQSQKFLALVTTLKYFFQSVRKILSGPCRSGVIKSIEACDAMLTKFRELWYQDYLLSLREQWRDLHEINFQSKIGVDDVVLVKNPAKTRPFWLMRRVLELIMGNGNKGRSVKIKKVTALFRVILLNCCIH